MNTERAEANLIDDAKQDYVGLYEIVWDLNEQYPDVSEGEKIAAARSIVRRLLASGEGAIFRSNSWPPNEYGRVGEKEALSLIELDMPFKLQEGTDSAMIYWLAVGT